jgi:hypothetical protein
MNIPDNMTQEQVLDTIELVCTRISPKYTFYGYGPEDIKQEAFIICAEALNRYDGIRPLENFLSINLSNRLKTFVRDNFFISTSHEGRKKVSQPAQLDYESSLVDHNEHYANSYENLDMMERVAIVDQYIPASVRMDYLKVVNDVYVSKQRREEVVEIIKGILEEHGYGEDDDEEG